jgi:hypothetical protein
MRIFEIDDQDRTYAASAGINLEIISDYKEATDILDLLIATRSANRIKHFMPRIVEIETNLTQTINANFADDESTKELKEKAAYYLDEIQKMKGM